MCILQGQCPSCFEYFDTNALEAHASGCYGLDPEEPKPGKLDAYCAACLRSFLLVWLLQCKQEF